MAAIIVHRLHSRHSNCDLGEPFAPRAAKRIRNDHRNRQPQLFLQPAMQPCCGSIGILRQQQRVASPIDVRNIHAVVRADQSVPGFRDQYSALAPHHAATLGQSQLDDSSINFVPPRPKA